MTANWKADSGDKWTVPVGAGVGKLFKVGKLPINTSLQGYYNAEKPNSFSSDWQLRFQVQFLLPKSSREGLARYRPGHGHHALARPALGRLRGEMGHLEASR